MSTLPRLNAGDLRHKVIIKHKPKVSDGKGGWTAGSWQTIASPRAEVLGLDGREAVIARSLQGISTYRIRIRFRDGIDAAQQVRHGNKDLNIRSVFDPNGDREQLIILADTGSAQVTA